jgi:hypothetical protein
MAGAGVLGAVLFILVFLIGQTLNMGITCWAPTCIPTAWSM